MHPKKYKPVMGKDKISIVIPVPSGVIIAENIRHIKMAFLHFFFQKAGPTSPSRLSKTMETGRRKIIPPASVKINTTITKSLTVKKVAAPIFTA